MAGRFDELLQPILTETPGRMKSNARFKLRCWPTGNAMNAVTSINLRQRAKTNRIVMRKHESVVGKRQTIFECVQHAGLQVPIISSTFGQLLAEMHMLNTLQLRRSVQWGRNQNIAPALLPERQEQLAHRIITSGDKHHE